MYFSAWGRSARQQVEVLRCHAGQSLSLLNRMPGGIFKIGHVTIFQFPSYAIQDHFPFTRQCITMCVVTKSSLNNVDINYHKISWMHMGHTYGLDDRDLIPSRSKIFFIPTSPGPLCDQLYAFWTPGISFLG
jgi:hypothetical protein